MAKRTPGHFADKVIRWGLKNWFKLGWAIFGASMLYMVHQIGDQFLAFTEYLYEKIEAHDASAPSTPSPDRPNTEG